MTGRLPRCSRVLSRTIAEIPKKHPVAVGGVSCQSKAPWLKGFDAHRSLDSAPNGKRRKGETHFVEQVSTDEGGIYSWPAFAGQVGYAEATYLHQCFVEVEVAMAGPNRLDVGWYVGIRRPISRHERRTVIAPQWQIPIVIGVSGCDEKPHSGMFGRLVVFVFRGGSADEYSTVFASHHSE